MRLLSDLLGLPVVSSDGRGLGHVHDLTVRLITSHPKVAGVLVDAGPRRTLLLAGTLTATVAETRVANGADETARAKGGIELGPDEILLRRDLLDTQIIDLHQHRVARVGDVLIESTCPTRARGRCRRGGRPRHRQTLGLRALAVRLPEHVVDFADLHLTSSHGHAAQIRVGPRRYTGWTLEGWPSCSPGSTSSVRPTCSTWWDRTGLPERSMPHIQSSGPACCQR